MNALRCGGLGLLALVVGAAAPGCATKHDIRDLQAQIVAVQARQDSLFRILQRQNRELLDSVRSTTDLLVRVRGDLGHQLLDLAQQLVQVQELTGQSQRRLQDLNAQLQQRQQQLQGEAQPDTGARPVPLPAGGPVTAGAPTPTSAADLYALAQTQLQNGAAGTARIAFQQLLRNFPGDSLAPAALLRAGGLQQQRGNVARAREYFQRILARYPRSPEAAQARRRLQSVRGTSTTPRARPRSGKGAAATHRVARRTAKKPKRR